MPDETKPWPGKSGKNKDVQKWVMFGRKGERPRHVTGTYVQNKKAAHEFARAIELPVRCQRQYGGTIYVAPDGRVKYGNGVFTEYVEDN